jgi:hypothetical protein
MASLGTIKRGDGFSFSASITDKATGDPLTGAAADLKCQGKYEYDDDVLVDMVITETATEGTYLFAAPDTSEWVPGVNVEFDIQYQPAGAKPSSSKTFTVTVERDVTT